MDTGTGTGALRLRLTTPPAPMSTEEARKLMEDYIKSSLWFQVDMMEPSIGDDGVPACAILLSREGESVYRCFVGTRRERKGKPMHYCTECGFKSKRLHQVIGHQRYKRGHSPFVCPDYGWCVHNLPPGSVWQQLTAPFVFVVVIFVDTQ